jgi:hypothetical protein
MAVTVVPRLLAGLTGGAEVSPFRSRYLTRRHSFFAIDAIVREFAKRVHARSAEPQRRKDSGTVAPAEVFRSFPGARFDCRTS